MSLTFDSLISDTKTELNRTDDEFVAAIPTFINTSLDIISAQFQTIGLNRYVTDVMLVGNPVILNPGRWRNPVSFNYGKGAGFNEWVTLDLLDYEYLTNYWPDRTQTGEPLFYAIYGAYNVLVAPTPAIAYPFEISYLELSPPLSIVNQTNWITNFAPSLLRFGTWVQAAIWADNEKLKAIFEDQYNKILASLDYQNKRRIIDRANTRNASV